MSDASRHALLDIAHRAADAARPAALAHFRTAGLAVTDKGGAAGYDPVTAADRAAETAIRAVLARERPDDAVLGEETGHAEGASGLTWVVDPIDGTRAFLIGAPTWGVLIALNDGTRPVLGLMDQPFTRDRLWGDGATAWLRRDDAPPQRLAVRRGVTLAQARLCTTYPDLGAPADTAAFARLAARVQLTRYGLDCTAYALLAMGGVDLVAEAGLDAYDIQALIPIIEGAGGLVTAWDGGDAQHGGRVLAAATPQLHAEAMRALAGPPA